MRELYILLAPVLWSVKNDIIRFNRSFYKKILLYAALSSVFLFLITKLLNIGMARLQGISPDVFNAILHKGYSLVFMLIFFMQIINGFIIALNTYYQSRDLEAFFISPVSRTALFFSRLIETHIKASWMLVIFGVPLILSSGIIYKASPFYYLYSLLLFAAFSTIPVNIGIGATMLLSTVFHAKNLRRILISTGIIAVILLVTLLRIFRPERFVNPELFANLTLFISEIKAPSFILLPNRWLADSIFGFLAKTFSSNTFIFISLLFLTSYITALLLQMVFKRYHYSGWLLLQGGGDILKRKERHGISHARGIMISRYIEPLIKAFDIQSRMLIKKELIYQIRDIKNIHQMLILFSLIIIYLFSIASLPLNWEEYGVQLRYIVAFFNLGLILIIAASLCARIVYPAVASEGASFWIIKTSPVAARSYVWTKLIYFFILISFISLILTAFSSFFIHIERLLFAEVIITVLILSLSLVSMAVVFGIYDLKPALNEELKEQTKTGSPILMIISIALIFFVLAIEAIPIFFYFLKESAQITFSYRVWGIMAVMFFVLFIVNLIVVMLSVSLSIRRVKRVQF